MQYRCDGKRYSPPSTYLNQDAAAGATDTIYDLAIIGSGAQAAYIVQLIRERMGDAAKALKIGIFEQGEDTGGRLMSSYGPGSLGFAAESAPRTEELATPPEYGGMRIDPLNHPLVWDAMEKVAAIKGKKCERSGAMKPVSFTDPRTLALYNEQNPDKAKNGIGQQGEGCTGKDGFMTRMYTADIRYFTGGSTKEFGEYLQSGGVKAGSPGTVEDNCLSLIALTQTYLKQNATAKAAEYDVTAATMVNDMCANCKEIKEMTNSDAPMTACEICSKLPDPGNNLVSCIGYDDLPKVAAAVGIGEGGAITGRADFNCKESLGSTDRCSYLYMFKSGTQTWVQDMLYAQGAQPQVGVVFEKKLTGLDWEGADTKGLSAAQAAKALAATGDQILDWNQDRELKDATKTDKPVKLSFEDGSVVRAKIAYVTAVPPDMQEIDGFAGWAGELHKSPPPTPPPLLRFSSILLVV